MVSRVDGHGGDEVILADIRAAQDGDAGAYARIVKSWGGRLLRFCRNNLPATIDAEDVVQDIVDGILVFARGVAADFVGDAFGGFDAVKKSMPRVSANAK